MAETLYRLGLNELRSYVPGSRSAPSGDRLRQPSWHRSHSRIGRAIGILFCVRTSPVKAIVRLYLSVPLAPQAQTSIPLSLRQPKAASPWSFSQPIARPNCANCNAGQAIDQHKLYGTFPQLADRTGDPLSGIIKCSPISGKPSFMPGQKPCIPFPGVVHLNLPFREPLAPIASSARPGDRRYFQYRYLFRVCHAVAGGRRQRGRRQKAERQESEGQQSAVSNQEPFQELELTGETPLPTPYSLLPTPYSPLPTSPNGIIIAGSAQPEAPGEYCRAIAHLSKSLGYPVLAEGLSPLRNYADLNPNLITTYDLILRNPTLAEKLAPETVIRVGGMPTSKQLRTWLEKSQPRQWIIDPDGRNLDPLHGNTTHIRLSIASFIQTIPQKACTASPYLDRWRAVEAQVRQNVDQMMRETAILFEGKAAWLLSQVLPTGTPLFINSSMPVRDVESFWAPSSAQVQPFFNRGANGIDGTLSTALGIAHRQQSSVMLTGDLALLHDTNGFLLRNYFVSHLTIVLINNNGGGIFEMLPIAPKQSIPLKIIFCHTTSDRLCQTLRYLRRGI